jgi:hypothetical protein
VEHGTRGGSWSRDQATKSGSRWERRVGRTCESGGN